jgi:hypothetical protein
VGAVSEKSVAFGITADDAPEITTDGGGVADPVDSSAGFADLERHTINTMTATARTAAATAILRRIAGLF